MSDFRSSRARAASALSDDDHDPSISNLSTLSIRYHEFGRDFNTVGSDNAQSIDAVTTGIHTKSTGGTSKAQHKARWLVRRAVLAASLGMLLWGYDIGASASALKFLTTHWKLSTSDRELAVSVSLIGASVASLLLVALNDLISRRTELLCGAIFYLLGSVAAFMAPNYLLFLLARGVLVGLGIGASTHGCVLYVLEITSSQRGLAIAFLECMTLTGVLLAQTAGLVFSLKCPDSGTSATVHEFGEHAVWCWRFVFAPPFLISILMLVGIVLCPPSPRWLLLSSLRTGGATADPETAARGRLTLAKWRGYDNVEKEMQDILNAIRTQRHAGWSAWTFAKRPLYIGMSLVVLQQLTGQPTVLVYAADQLADITTTNSVSSGIAIALVATFIKLIATSFAVLFVDRIGRRPLMLAGVSMMLVGIAGLAIALSATDKPYLALEIVLLSLYFVGYQVGFGPLTWLVVTEILPLQSRGRAFAVTLFMNFATYLMVSMTYMIASDSMGRKGPFWVFTVMTMIALVFVYTYIVETKSMTLEQLEEAMLQSNFKGFLGLIPPGLLGAEDSTPHHTHMSGSSGTMDDPGRRFPASYHPPVPASPTSVVSPSKKGGGGGTGMREFSINA